MCSTDHGWAPVHTCCKLPIHQLIQQAHQKQLQTKKKQNKRQSRNVVEEKAKLDSDTSPSPSFMTDIYTQLLRLVLQHCPDINARIFEKNNSTELVTVPTTSEGTTTINTADSADASKAEPEPASTPQGDKLKGKQKGSGLTPLDLAIQSDNDIAVHMLLYRTYQPHSSHSQCQLAISHR